MECESNSSGSSGIDNAIDESLKKKDLLSSETEENEQINDNKSEKSEVLPMQSRNRRGRVVESDDDDEGIVVTTPITFYIRLTNFLSILKLVYLLLLIMQMKQKLLLMTTIFVKSAKELTMKK